MTIVDELTPRQCAVLEIIQGRSLTREEIATQVKKDPKTVERILKSLPKSLLRKKRDTARNGSPYTYGTKKMRRNTEIAFGKKMQDLYNTGKLPHGTPSHPSSQAPSHPKG
jgi:predicted transcriptional regulator